MIQSQSGNIRYNLIKTGRKPLLVWLWDFRLAIPHRVWNSELERFEWRTKKNDRWLYGFSKPIYPTDAAYEEAEYEMGFLFSVNSADRLIPEKWPNAQML